MELKLKVYKTQREVEKEYKVDGYDLMTGTVEEILKEIDIEKILSKSDDEQMIELIKFVTKNFNRIYPIVHDMFGITEEEYKRTKVKELATVLIQFVATSLDLMNKLETKN